MKLERYFEFLADGAIRIAGTRVGIETVVGDFQEGTSPEEIGLRSATLTLGQTHATITYYPAHLLVRRERNGGGRPSHCQASPRHPSTL